MNVSSELAPVYGFIGGLWLREPTQGDLETWNTVCSAMPGLPSETVSVSEPLDNLHAEYCRLFVGPKDHLPPIQSVWQTGQLGGPSAISMERYVEHSGFTRSDAEFQTPADHIGVQLQLFGWLLAQPTVSETTVAAEVLREYHAAHLCWPEELLGRVAVAAEAELFRQLAIVTEQLVKLPLSLA